MKRRDFLKFSAFVLLAPQKSIVDIARIIADSEASQDNDKFRQALRIIGDDGTMLECYRYARKSLVGVPRNYVFSTGVIGREIRIVRAELRENDDLISGYDIEPIYMAACDALTVTFERTFDKIWG